MPFVATTLDIEAIATRINATVSAVDDARAIGRILRDAMHEISETSAFSVALFHADRPEVVYRYTVVGVDAASSELGKPPVDDSPSCVAVHNPQRWYTFDRTVTVADEPRRVGVLQVPLIDASDAIGVVTLQTFREGGFPPAELDLIAAIVGATASGFARARAAKRFQPSTGAASTQPGQPAQTPLEPAAPAGGTTHGILPDLRAEGRAARTPPSLVADLDPEATILRGDRVSAPVDGRGIDRVLLPWFLAFGFVVPLALAVEGPARVFTAGLACGVLIGTAFAWRLHIRDRATGLAATARVRATTSAESDARANVVLMQFEWAVHDIATLRAKLEKAELEVREHAEHAFGAERDVRSLERYLRGRDRRSAVRAVKTAATAPEPVGAELDVILLRCALNDTGPLPWLDLGADDADNLPSRVRVFNRAGTVMCVSDPAVNDGLNRNASLKLPLPPDLAIAVRRGDLDDYRFEALVAHRWVGVRMTGSAPIVHHDVRRVGRPA